MKETLQSLISLIGNHLKIAVIGGIAMSLIVVIMLVLFSGKKASEATYPTTENPVSVEVVDEVLPTATIYFDKQILDISKGQNYTVYVGIDVQNSPANGAELSFTWDPSEITGVYVAQHKDTTSPLSSALKPYGVIQDDEKGNSIFTLLMDGDVPPQKGSGQITAITFTALTDTPTNPLVISESSRIMTTEGNFEIPYTVSNLVLQ